MWPFILRSLTLLLQEYLFGEWVHSFCSPISSFFLFPFIFFFYTFLHLQTLLIPLQISIVSKLFLGAVYCWVLVPPSATSELPVWSLMIQFLTNHTVLTFEYSSTSNTKTKSELTLNPSEYLCSEGSSELWDCGLLSIFPK